MHAPFLSAVRDRDGDGVAEDRRDLLTGLGLPPEKNPSRLHCANGVVVGHDGWLYLALGDNGCDVPRPEGDRLVFHGGGILRCRPDGRDLHVFATGLRNIYDVALDEELNVFVRDNENDGGDYLIRVDHSFFGADHGYPYLYDERPDEALPSLAILGRGSSAGGLCYLEAGFPAEYRGDLFFCEWGRAVVRYRPARSGSGFAPLEQIEFAAGGDGDPYGFKPTDLVAQRDGSLIVADWADGQQPKRGRGRIYRITAPGPPRPTASGAAAAGSRARSPGSIRTSYAERCEAQVRLERRGREGLAAVRDAIRRGPHRRCGGGCTPSGSWPTWAGRPRSTSSWSWPGPIPTRGSRPRPSAPWRTWPTRCSPGIAWRAVRAMPSWPRGWPTWPTGRDPRVVLEVDDRGRPAAAGPGPRPGSRRTLRQPDAALAHAAMQALRRSANWPAVLALLDGPDSGRRVPWRCGRSPTAPSPRSSTA